MTRRDEKVFMPFVHPSRTDEVVRDINRTLQTQTAAGARTKTATTPTPVDTRDRELLAALFEDFLRRYRSEGEPAWAPDHYAGEYAFLVDDPFLE